MTIDNSQTPPQDPIPEEPVGEQPPALPTTVETGETTSEPQELTAEQKQAVAIAIGVFLLLLALIIGGIVFLLRIPAEETARIRDIFIIFMALESLLIGLVLVVLVVQLARLINLLQNEIKPILDSTNETVSHLRGTTVFLSDNLAEPVIRLNEYLAGLSQFFTATGLGRRKSKKKKQQTQQSEGE